MITKYVAVVQGTKYAAVQAGSWCFCGNENNRYGENHVCNSACTGAKNEICGGGWANQMYQIGEI